MSKASIDRPDGTKITIDGTPEEVARILRLIEESPAERAPKTARPATGKKLKTTMRDHILELKGEGFFKEKRSRSEVTSTLGIRGHIYDPNSLGKTLLRMVRSQELGRVKESGKWMYVHRD